MTENESITLDYLKTVVMWKELFYFSLFSFIISLILFPFSLKWGMFMIFLIIGIWTRVPGWIHFSMNKIVIIDLFTYILALYEGFFIALFYILITTFIGLYMGPKAWPLYVMREMVGFITSALIISLIPAFQSNLVMGYFTFLVIDYAVYYFLVLVFSADEILTEILVLPAVIFFDFIWTAKGLGFFQGTINGLMVGEYMSGWPLLFVIAFTLTIAYYGKKILAERVQNTNTYA